MDLQFVEIFRDFHYISSNYGNIDEYLDKSSQKLHRENTPNQRRKS